MHPGFAKTARDEGFIEIAEWFETLAKAEKSHAGRFAQGPSACARVEKALIEEAVMTMTYDLRDGRNFDEADVRNEMTCSTCARCRPASVSAPFQPCSTTSTATTTRRRPHDPAEQDRSSTSASSGFQHQLPWCQGSTSGRSTSPPHAEGRGHALHDRPGRRPQKATMNASPAPTSPAGSARRRRRSSTVRSGPTRAPSSARH